ncbi:hypothetical protein PEC302110_05520 [Pectobacterium araliae]|uniref:Uncharacterized protein n=1 Tax=Pectobacterium araliae TaxID=3073862 RepID=A0AAN0KAF8_9GAMM|nr:hypothetical protein PEC302110_05520 [Pectobacterium sp. MAFF 302110]
MMIEKTSQQDKRKGERKNTHLFQLDINPMKNKNTTNHPEKAHLSYQKGHFLSH